MACFPPGGGQVGAQGRREKENSLRVKVLQMPLSLSAFLMGPYAPPPQQKVIGTFLQLGCFQGRGHPWPARNPHFSLSLTFWGALLVMLGPPRICQPFVPPCAQSGPDQWAASRPVPSWVAVTKCKAAKRMSLWQKPCLGKEGLKKKGCRRTASPPHILWGRGIAEGWDFQNWGGVCATSPLLVSYLSAIRAGLPKPASNFCISFL